VTFRIARHHIETQADLPEVPDLLGIESEVREALTNLVLNAVDALPHGGKITVRSSLIARLPKSRQTSHASRSKSAIPAWV
jgi:signal transduction histidine kinase